jgi:hypothetical protein
VKKINKIHIFLGLGALVVIILAAAPAYYFYDQYRKSQELVQNPTLAAEQEVKMIKEKVGKLIDLPQNEEMTLATVSDKDKLKDQIFFAKAENGDKVLIFNQSTKAILYRPSQNKVIEVSSVNSDSQAQASASASTTPLQVRIVLRNGTSTNGLTGKIEPEIKKHLPTAEIVTKENASRSDYDKTLVVALSEVAQEPASQLAQALKANFGALPEGEKPITNADILVILGKESI